MNSHPICSHSTRTDLLLMTMIWTLTPSQNRTFRQNHDHSCTRWLIDCERLDHSSKDATQDDNKHSSIWRMFLTSTLEASIFMGRILRKLRSIKYTGKDLTLKQMFDISEKLIVGQSSEFYGVTPINWEDSSWKQLSLVSDEEVVSLSHANVYVFSDSVVCLKMHQNPQSNTVWEDKLTWFKSSSQYRALDAIEGEPMEFEWNIFPQITTLQLINSPRARRIWAQSQKFSLDGSSSCGCSMTSHGDLKTMNGNANLTPTSFLFMREGIRQEDGHSSDLDQKRSCILLMIADHKENRTESLNW